MLDIQCLIQCLTCLRLEQGVCRGRTLPDGGQGRSPTNQGCKWWLTTHQECPNYYKGGIHHV